VISGMFLKNYFAEMMLDVVGVGNLADCVIMSRIRWKPFMINFFIFSNFTYIIGVADCSIPSNIVVLWWESTSE
jgi:hypothetical protein